MARRLTRRRLIQGTTIAGATFGALATGAMAAGPGDTGAGAGAAPAVSTGAAAGAASPAAAPRPKFRAAVMRLPIEIPISAAALEDTRRRNTQAMLEAIAGARRSITLATYIFDGDQVGRRFVDALAAARARGVEVRVLIDAAGVRYHRPPAHKLLRAAGVPCALFLPMRRAFPRYWNLRNHRKVMVVDGALAFTGGINLRVHHWFALAPAAPTHDLHFRLTGPVVAQLQEVFVDDWGFATGEALAGAPWFAAPIAGGAVHARALPEGPDDESDPVPWTILTALGVARQRVCVVSPYFLPDPPLVAALDAAALRGVQVDVVIPARTNFRFVDAAVRGGLWQLRDHGVRIWMTPPPFDHTKLMTIDGAWALLGSSNWDPRSMRLNFELDVEAYDRALVVALDALIDARIAKARRFTRAELDGRRWYRRVLDGAASVAQPYL